MRKQTQLALETNGSSIREGPLSLRGWLSEESNLPWLRISQRSRSSWKRVEWIFKTADKFLHRHDATGHLTRSSENTPQRKPAFRQYAPSRQLGKFSGRMGVLVGALFATVLSM